MYIIVIIVNSSRIKSRCACGWSVDRLRVLLLVAFMALLGHNILIQAWTIQHHQLYPMTKSNRIRTMLQMSNASEQQEKQVISLLSSRAKGSAAVPYQKQKIITMGNGGYLGGILFGYLQRASTIYTTGIGGGSSSSIRSIGATADTSIRLNRILNKHFVLANADESCIKLTNLTCVDAIHQRMIGYDALVLGTSLYLERKKLAANTYEVTPNDKAWEIYWDEPKGSYTDFDQSTEANHMKKKIISNFISAAQLAKLKHIFLVVTTTSPNSNTDKVVTSSILQQVKASNIPFTCIHIPYKLIDRSSQGYTYQEGVLCKDLIVESVADITTTDTTEKEECDNMCIYREDVAALCVQAIQSCDWNPQQPRYLEVRISKTPPNQQNAVPSPPGIPKRMDQLWCVNSFILEEQLNRIP